MTRRYVVYDVFTDQRLAGNPLAVVLDAEGLDIGTMQKIAREFNLSETTFVGPAKNPVHSARVRIFTPEHEMPFAGHPTVGTAIALAERDGGTGDRILVLEENVGPVRCAVASGSGTSFAEFDLPRLPESRPFEADASGLAHALGLEPGDIGFDGHAPSLWSASVPYLLVPVSGLDAASRVRMDGAAWRAMMPPGESGVAVSAYVYCRETVLPDADLHARMFTAGAQVWEDPATGSAAAAFAGAIAQFERPVDGTTVVHIEQGVEMGRPSLIRLSIETTGGAITAARIGGHAVKIAEGSLLV